MISCSSNFVAKNAFAFSGSLIEISVSKVTVSASSTVSFFGKKNVKIFFLLFFGCFNLQFSDISETNTILYVSQINFLRNKIK